MKKDVSEISNWWSVVAVIVNIVMFCGILFVVRKRGSGFGELINYDGSSPKITSILLYTVLIVSLGMGGMFLAGLVCYGVFPYAAPMLIAPIPGWIAILNILLLPVTTALAEDTLYLGCGVNQIQNKYLAVIVPALFFSLQHSFIPTLFDVRYMLYRFLSFLPLTIILCILYRKKRDPIPIMVGHAIIDLATAAQIAATSLIPGFYDMMVNAQK